MHLEVSLIFEAEAVSLTSITCKVLYSSMLKEREEDRERERESFYNFKRKRVKKHFCKKMFFFF